MGDAIGLIETKGLVGVIEASDAMCKAASVELIRSIEIGGGFVTTIVRGDVAACARRWTPARLLRGGSVSWCLLTSSPARMTAWWKGC